MTTPDEIPDQAQEQLRKAVDTALAKPAKAQGFLNSVPDLSGVGDIKTKALDVLTDILKAIDTIQTYSWIIPDQYEAPLQKLEDALRKVQGWLS